MHGWNKMRQAFFGVGINRVTCPISIMAIRLTYIQELIVRFYHWVPYAGVTEAALGLVLKTMGTVMSRMGIDTSLRRQ